jgi:hypothetical protein
LVPALKESVTAKWDTVEQHVKNLLVQTPATTEELALVDFVNAFLITLGLTAVNSDAPTVAVGKVPATPMVLVSVLKAGPVLAATSPSVPTTAQVSVCVPTVHVIVHMAHKELIALFQLV